MANRTRMLTDSPLRLCAMLALLGLPLSGVAHAQRALPPAQPAQVEPEPQEPGEPEFPEGTVSFSAFAEPMELTTLIDLVGESLDINIAVRGSPEGEVVFNAPIEVPKRQLIDLLDAMLDQYGFTITYESATGFYVVQPSSEIKPAFGDQLATTRIIETPNIKPSLLVDPLNATLAGPNQPSGGTGNAIQAVDELGVLIINATARDIRRIEAMVEQLITIDRDQEFIRFELDHLAAPTALNRVIGLAGGGTDANRGNAQQNNRNQQGNNQQGTVGLAGSSLTNLYERITIDPQGNALIFKGTRNEIDRVRELLAVIDVPNTLEPKNYFAGSSASQIADIAKRRGLGEVIQIEAQQTNPFNQFNQFNNRNNQLNQDDEAGQGGPVMVVDPMRGNIIYYGTPEQQAQLAALLQELKTEDERVVIREYQLNHTDALTVTDLLNAIITGEQQTGDSDLLPGGTNRNNAPRTFINGIPVNPDGETGMFDPERVSVIADEFNNQVVVRAPVRQQGDLERLIGRLDRQRAQVYIEALIVSVTDNEDFTLAFESQLNRGDFGIGTNFGLSNRDNFTDPKEVSAGLGGLTTAIINSDYIPLIINATQTDTDVRILSSPQLLVNDNQESEIVSIQEEPFSEISQGDGGNVTGFAGTVDAGTTLRVTPSISKAGFIRLEYFVELSSFIGQGGDGLPPPTNRRTVTGSATVPSNATIVLGGITVDDVRDTIIKVPFVGDIPLVGELFRRTNKVNNKSRLYVFLTPRIMSDTNFNDLKLFSQGPQSEMQINDDIPEMQPAIIGSSEAHRFESELPRVQDPEGESPAQQGQNPGTGAALPAMEPEHIEVSEAGEAGGS